MIAQGWRGWSCKLTVGVLLLAGAIGWLSPAAVAAQDEPDNYSLRFYGHGVEDIDRAKIPVQTDAGSLPTDIGASDFTIEFWLRGALSENRSGMVTCGENEDWIYGSIVLDRDRFAEGRKFGLSIDGGGRVVFGVTNQAREARTVCGVTNVLDNDWHHIAVQRARDGQLWVYVDGRLDGTAAGPVGDISYPDNTSVTFQGPTYCLGPNGTWAGFCRNEPFLVIAAEKHDAGASEGNPAAYPSFSGWVDELRLSTVLRYAEPFVVPATPFASDPATVGLYHFDEGPAGPCTGTIIDSADGSGSPTNGDCFYGGAGVAGPEYSLSNPFAAVVTPTGTPVIVLPTPTATPTVLPTSTQRAATNTPVMPTATATSTPIPPTATSTTRPPTATATRIPPTATATPLPPTATPAAVPPIGNSALSFDGVDDVVIAAAANHAGVLTVEFWVRPSSSAMEAIIINQADDVDGWSVELNDGRPSFWVATSGGWQVVRHSTLLAGGTWYHVAATYNNGAARVFVNGQPGTAATLPSGLRVAADLRFGGIPGYGRFAGNLDDVRISQVVRYSAAFTPPATLPALDTNTLGQWALNEGNGQRTADAGPAANAGQLGTSPAADAADPAWVAVAR